jgi:hypothetical protein
MSSTATTIDREEQGAGVCAPAPARKGAHCPDNARYVGYLDTDSHGRRHTWLCPSSREGHDAHRLWTGPGGEEPSCTCEAYTYSGTCGLVEGREELLVRLYRDRARGANSGTLRDAGRDYRAKEVAGTLTRQDRLAWTAIQDTALERLIAFEAGQTAGRTA